MNSNLEEEWKDIEGFEGKYAVSNRGRVKNLRTGRILKYGSNPNGYAIVGLCNGSGKPKAITVHKLVPVISGSF